MILEIDSFSKSLKPIWTGFTPMLPPRDVSHRSRWWYVLGAWKAVKKHLMRCSALQNWLQNVRKESADHQITFYAKAAPRYRTRYPLASLSCDTDAKLFGYISPAIRSCSLSLSLARVPFRGHLMPSGWWDEKKRSQFKPGFWDESTWVQTDNLGSLKWTASCFAFPDCWVFSDSGPILFDGIS
jgi:hypothetical protein